MPEEKKLAFCESKEVMCFNPDTVKCEKEDCKRTSQIKRQYEQIVCDQSRSNAIADNADIFTINRDVEMFYVQRIQIPYLECLNEICQLANQLRKKAVFIGRQTHFFRTRKNYADLSKRYPDFAKRILSFMETKLDDPNLTDELKRKLQNPALELSETVRRALGKFKQSESLDEFLKFELVYKKLGAIYSPLPQQVLKYVANSWTSYYEGHAIWEKNPELFDGEPRIPSTRKKEKEFLISFPAGTFTKLKNQTEHYNATRQPTRRSKKRKYVQYRESGELLLPSAFLKHFSDFPKIRTTIDLKSIIEVRIVPKKCCYEAQIVYKIFKKPKNLDDKKAYSIDIGANNLIALTNNFGEQSMLVRGRPVKSNNQWMNKKIGTLRSAQTKGIIFKKGQLLSETLEMAKIRRKRDNIINDYFHKASRFIIERCLNSGTKNLAIGYNSGWKKDLLNTEDKKMGFKQRQNFAYIPFLKLIEMIQYKAELVGINVSIIRESHTSKCSAVDFESIEHHDEYMGIRGISRKGKNKKKLIENDKPEFKRYKARGLFRTKDGYIIHSDVNASYNIGRRAFPELFNERILSIRAMLKSPISVRIV